MWHLVVTTNKNLVIPCRSLDDDSTRRFQGNPVKWLMPLVTASSFCPHLRCNNRDLHSVVPWLFRPVGILICFVRCNSRGSAIPVSSLDAMRSCPMDRPCSQRDNVDKEPTCWKEANVGDASTMGVDMDAKRSRFALGTICNRAPAITRSWFRGTSRHKAAATSGRVMRPLLSTPMDDLISARHRA